MNKCFDVVGNLPEKLQLVCCQCCNGNNRNVSALPQDPVSYHSLWILCQVEILCQKTSTASMYQEFNPLENLNVWMVLASSCFAEKECYISSHLLNVVLFTGVGLQARLYGCSRCASKEGWLNHFSILTLIFDDVIGMLLAFALLTSVSISLERANHWSITESNVNLN